MHQLKVPPHPKKVRAVSHWNDRKVNLDSIEPETEKVPSILEQSKHTGPG